MDIIKRNGTVEKLTKKKIFDSICKANDCVQEDSRLTQKQIRRITDSVATACEEFEEPIPIDRIEDMIEKKLMEASGYEVAKKYITYRYEKERVRNNIHLTEKLMAKNVVNQNANVDEFSFGGRMGEAASYMMKEYAIANLLSPMAKRNHMNNEIYIHDLDQYAIGSHNCLSIPFDKLLKNGFNTRQVDIRPAGSINTAFQLVAVIFQIQSLQQFGGVSATHLDWTMVPYVRKSFKKHFIDGLIYIKGYGAECSEINHLKKYTEKETNRCLVNMGYEEGVSIESDVYGSKLSDVYLYAFDKTKSELKQAVEGLYHNLNSLQSRSGNQLPFTSINYGTCTLTEGRMVIEALLECSIEGVGKFHKTSIFPCGIFQCMNGINRKPGDPNYDLFRLALKSTAQRLYPNYANVNWSGNAGYDIDNPLTYFTTMGCRTSNGLDINAENPKLAQLKDGRGNICPVTLILPELAMQTKEKVMTMQKENIENGYDIFTEDWFENTVKDEFIKLLVKKIVEAKDMLIERFDWICSQPPESARFMYENGTFTGYKPEKGIRSALKHGTLAIGQLGLAEALQILIGCDHTCDKGMEFANVIEKTFNVKCAEFKKQYKLNFGVYYTPAENLCYTAMTKFIAKHGVIPNVSDKKFFTNSMHVPVWKSMTPFEKIDIESKLTGYSNAGCITYVELDSGAKNNLGALEAIVTYAMDKDIPYFAINVPSDTCLSCGYQDEINDACPECGSDNVQHLRRVTGYLTGDYKTAFNLGKQNEVEMRVRHQKFNAVEK